MTQHAGDDTYPPSDLQSAYILCCADIHGTFYRAGPICGAGGPKYIRHIRTLVMLSTTTTRRTGSELTREENVHGLESTIPCDGHTT